MLAIRLDSDTENRLALLARKTGRTKTFYAREAILEHLQDLEDIYLASRLVMGDTRNLKVTYPQDLEMATMILNSTGGA